MRLLLGLIFAVAGWLFMVENDQEHITITLPGSGQIGPFSVGVVVLRSVLSGIVLCLSGGFLLKVVSRLKKSRSPAGGPSGSEPPHASH